MAETVGSDEDAHRRRRDGARVTESGGNVTESFGDDSGGGGDDASLSGVSCSICLELVSDDGCRSRAKLQCGHEFHLDCIGSAFNTKGSMQCPNCRKIEKGRWLYSNGSGRPFPELIMEDWSPDEEFYGLNYPEMHYRVHWCPFGELPQVGPSFDGPSFEELDSPSMPYHDIQGHHALFAEHLTASSMGHSYLAYVGQIPAVTPRSSENIDESNQYHSWNGLSGQNETFNPHVVNVPYHGWDHQPPPFSIPGNAEPIQGETDISTGHRSYPHPFVFGYRYNPRAGSSIIPSAVPRHPGNRVQSHERVQISQSFHHQPPNGNVSAIPSPGIPITRINMQVHPHPRPPPPEPDQNGGFYVFHPSSSSSQNPHELETDHFHPWETTDWFSRFPVPSRDSPWGFHHRPTSTSFWSRHFS